MSLSIKILLMLFFGGATIGMVGYFLYVIFKKDQSGNSIWKEIIKWFKNLWK